MGIRQFLRARSISFKLNGVLILIFAMLAVNVVVLTISTIGNLFANLSEKRVADEEQLANANLIQFEQNIIRDAQLLAISPDVMTAVTGGGQLDVDLPSLRDFDLYRNTVVEIFDIHGNPVFTHVPPGIQYTGTAIDRVLRLTLVGGDIGDIVVEEGGREPRPFLVGAVPIANAARNVVGAVILSRPIDAPFLDALGYGREDIKFFVIVEGQVVANNADEAPPADMVNTPMAAQALSGEVVNGGGFVNLEGIAHQVSYWPLRINERIRGVLVALIEFEDLFVAQQQQVTASTLGIVIPAVVAMGIVGVMLLFTVVRPLSRLKKVTERVTEGDLTTRAEVSSNDEVGQLAATFNIMAEAIEYRDKVQIAKLEGQLLEVEAARAKAERADQVKSAFLASMSHELRTPLNAIINFSRFVVEGDTGPVNAQQEDLLNEVVNSARHLLTLINDVLDMSKIEADSLNLFIEDDVNLNTILTNVISTGRSLLADKPVRIQTSIEDNLPLIRGDRQRIRQILLNIMSNACKFTEEGEIRVNVRQSKDELVISIVDTGPGIAPEDQSLVFEAFQQTKTGLRQGGGTGFGMPIAKSLTEAHGGRLWLESEPGKGAAFYVSLPIKSEQLVPIMA